MGNFTINDQFSITMLVYQRVTMVTCALMCGTAPPVGTACLQLRLHHQVSKSFSEQKKGVPTHLTELDGFHRMLKTPKFNMEPTLWYMKMDENGILPWKTLVMSQYLLKMAIYFVDLPTHGDFQQLC